MSTIARVMTGILFAVLAVVAPPGAYAAATTEIGVVIMHGKGGRPDKYVDVLANALEADGFLVANLEMPWSGRRNYDTDMNGAVAEIDRAVEQLRAKGAHKIFVSGHSQGGLFAVHYAGLRQVDGIIAIAPGGAVDVRTYVDALGEYVAKAKQMIADGRGNETSSFADYEGSRGTTSLTTTAAIYFDWFNPEGAQTSLAFAKVNVGTPVLYVAPSRDYPGLIKSKQKNFSALPAHPLTRIYQPDTDHLNSPGVSAAAISQWMSEVAAQ